MLANWMQTVQHDKPPPQIGGTTVKMTTMTRMQIRFLTKLTLVPIVKCVIIQREKEATSADGEGGVPVFELAKLDYPYR